MHTELSTGSVAAIATITAAVITAAISFVNLTLTKEQKTSEFRQAWIDGLREDLASFFATVRAFARSVQELQHFGKGARDGAPLAFTEQKVSDLRYQVAETRYRIQLRLNLKEPEHAELLRLMQVAIELQQRVLAGEGTAEQTLNAVETAAAYAPQILKSEWERVKKGERPFQLARNWIAPSVFLLALVFVGLLWTRTLAI